MAAGSTYTPIATTTLGSAQSSVTFSSLGSYTDIIAVLDLAAVASQSYYCLMRFNSDSGTNYSYTNLNGNNTSAISDRGSNTTGIYTSYAQITNPDRVISNVHIQNYSNSTTYKTALVRSNAVGQNSASAMVELWRSTAAVTSISFHTSANQFATGSIFTLYGIAAA